ncbi:MAG: hypothetical protein R3E79_47750 [Caldilineaceae bacterium]
MAKKLQNLESKLGSWTDQATLTRSQSAAGSPADAPGLPAPMRASYPIARSLIDRIATVAEQQGMSQNELVGHLLTWALDQVESGAYQLPTPKTH